MYKLGNIAEVEFEQIYYDDDKVLQMVKGLARTTATS